MVDTTLTQIRTHIESLVSDDGTCELICGRTGERPIPVDGFRLENRETVRATAHTAKKYRSALRRYDPGALCYDLVASEHNDRSGFGSATAIMEGWATTGVAPGLSEPPYNLGTNVDDRMECVADGGRSERVEFCHRIMATVFEAFVDADYRAVETTVMNVYFDLAETMFSADDLCLRLLESMATTLHVHFTSIEQADMLERAALDLASRPDAMKALTTTLAEMERLNLVGSCICSAWRSGPDATIRAAELTSRDYALSARGGRLPVPPVVLGLYRRASSWRPVSLHVTSTESG